VFFEKWNDKEKSKNKSEKRELGKHKWYNQMGQVGTSWSTWDKWDKEKGVFRSSWDKWDKDKGSVHLNHSTCPKWDYKAVDFSFEFSGFYYTTKFLRILRI
jgi:hypothetical protein